MHEKNNIYFIDFWKKKKKKSRKSPEDKMHDCTDLDRILVSANNKHTFYCTQANIKIFFFAFIS